MRVAPTCSYEQGVDGNSVVTVGEYGVVAPSPARLSLVSDIHKLGNDMGRLVPVAVTQGT